jgi:uncharacterized protein (TIGR04255 family)
MATGTLGTWRNPPLAYVVAELRISPHYSVVKAIRSIQDSLRQTYPRTVEATEVTVDSDSPFTPMPAWRLLAADQTRGAMFGSRAISLHATSYVNSGDFLRRWREVLDAVKFAQLDAYVERAGLRYVDLIVPSKGTPTNEYLVTDLHGLQPPKGSVVRSAMWATTFVIDGVTVQARTAAPSGEGELLPPNFIALPLRKPAIMIEAEKTLLDGGQIGFIDTDCSIEAQQVFDADRISQMYGMLHQRLSETFKALMSQRAHKEWK